MGITDVICMILILHMNMPLWLNWCGFIYRSSVDIWQSILYLSLSLYPKYFQCASFSRYYSVIISLHYVPLWYTRTLSLYTSKQWLYQHYSCLFYSITVQLYHYIMVMYLNTQWLSPYSTTSPLWLCHYCTALPLHRYVTTYGVVSTIGLYQYIEALSV